MELKKDMWITVTCAKAPGAFSVRSISGGEELGTLYEYHVELISKLPEPPKQEIACLVEQVVRCRVLAANREFSMGGLDGQGGP